MAWVAAANTGNNDINYNDTNMGLFTTITAIVPYARTFTFAFAFSPPTRHRQTSNRNSRHTTNSLHGICLRRRCSTYSASTTKIMTTIFSKIPPPISDTTPCRVIDDTTFDFGDGEEFYFLSSEEYSVLPKGDRGGYHIVKQYTMPMDDHNNGNTNNNINTTGNPNNTNAIAGGCGTTLQNALVALDPGRYPTLTRARKACRKGMVLVNHRIRHKINHNDTEEELIIANTDNDDDGIFRRGRVGDPIYPGDVIGCQLFLGTYRKKQCYPNVDYSRPQFELEVVYEDDYLAVVNKPSGIAVYSDTRNSNSNGNTVGNRRTVHFLLPFLLTPPKRGTTGGLLRRPGIVHRLDKATSGLLVVAKTKVAMESLKEQFRTRRIQKLYTAIVNGDLLPEENRQRQDQQSRGRGTLQGKPQVEVHHLEYGRDFGNNNVNNTDNNNDYSCSSSTLSPCWNTIDYPLGGKHASTSWKILRRSPSLNARDGILTKIHVRLHTGRYHQIRRHLAWWCRKPLVGDPLYAGLLQAHHFRKRGLCLCSTGISFFHPADENDNNNDGDDDKTEEKRRVEVTIDIPKRFDKLMNAEEAWAKTQFKERSSVNC